MKLAAVLSIALLLMGSAVWAVEEAPFGGNLDGGPLAPVGSSRGVLWEQLPYGGHVWGSWEDSANIYESGDDFECTDPCPITSVEWWGFFHYGAAPGDYAFRIRFCTDAPGPPSHPGTVLYEETCTSWSEEPYGSSFTHYTADLPVPFYQEPGNTYWIVIQAVYGDGWYFPTTAGAWLWIECDDAYDWGDISVSRGPGAGDAWEHNGSGHHAFVLHGSLPGPNIVFDPDTESLSIDDPDCTVDVNYLGCASGLVYGYTVDFSWDPSLVSCAPGDVTEGTLLSSIGPTLWDVDEISPGLMRADCIILGAYDGTTGPGTMFSIDFHAVTAPPVAYGTSLVEITVDRIRDRDNNALTGFTTGDAEIFVDTEKPTSSVNALPPYHIDSFFDVYYTADDPSGSGLTGVDLFYRVDGGTWTSFGTFTSSPIAFDTGLVDGFYEFYTLATDAHGNVEDPPVTPDASTTVDTVDPTSSVNALPPYHIDSFFDVYYTADDGLGSGVDDVELFYRVDGGTWTSFGTFTSSPIPFDTGGVDGFYEFYTIATDVAGNVEVAPTSPDASTTVDTVDPTSSVDPLPLYHIDSFFDVTFTADDGLGSGVDDVELFYRIEGGTWTSFGSHTSSPIPFVGGPDGFYEFYTIATDLAGNDENPPVTPDASTTVDGTPPEVVNVELVNLTLPLTNDYVKDGDYLELTADVSDALYTLAKSDITADLSGLLDGGGMAVEAETYDGSTATWTLALEDVDLTGDGAKTVTVYAKDGAGGTGSGSDGIIVDNTPPTPVTGFNASPGNGKCELVWTNGTDAHLAGVVIRRGEVVGDYPQYPYFVSNWPTVAYPADQSAGVGVYEGTGTSHTDLVSDRNIYYYQAFCYDEALNYGAADTSASDLATNYWLGDVSDGFGGGWGYDGVVDDGDILMLGDSYWTEDPVDVPGDAECDVGPTVHPNGSRLGLPRPDDDVEFEDAMIFAMNYGVVTPRVVPFLPGEYSPVPLALNLCERGTTAGELEVALRLEGNSGEVKGMSAVIGYDTGELEFVSARLSEDVSSPLADVFFWSGTKDGAVLVDAMVLGTGVTIGGCGDVAVLTFRVAGEGYALEIESARIRDVDNGELDAKLGDLESGDDTPLVFRLAQNAPNPFNPKTTVAYHVPSESDVTIRVYDVSGRVVRTLVDGVVDPGRHEVVWDGRNDAGKSVGSGIYFCTMEAPDFRQSRKMALLK